MVLMENRLVGTSKLEKMPKRACQPTALQAERREGSRNV